MISALPTHTQHVVETDPSTLWHGL